GPGCTPFGDNKVPIHVTALSFATPGGDGGVFMPPDGGVDDPSKLVPHIVFNSGTLRGGVLEAGPARVQLSIPFRGDNAPTLPLSGAHIQMKLSERGQGTYVGTTMNPMTGKTVGDGLLGGVLQAVTLAQLKNLDLGGLLKPEQSLLDAVFVGPVSA